MGGGGCKYSVGHYVGGRRERLMSTPKSQIRMIYFDYGRVLFDHRSDIFAEDLANISRQRELPVEVVRKLYRFGLVRRYDLGAITTEEFLRGVQKLIGFSDQEEFISIW